MFLSGGTAGGPFCEIVKGQLKMAEKNPDDYLWYTFWFLIRKTDRIVVGAVVFKDVSVRNRRSRLVTDWGKSLSTTAT